MTMRATERSEGVNFRTWAEGVYAQGMCVFKDLHILTLVRLSVRAVYQVPFFFRVRGLRLTAAGTLKHHTASAMLALRTDLNDS